VQGIGVAAWSSAAPLNTAIYYNTGAGIQTAALSFQGAAGADPTTTTQTEEYNGSGWSIGGALPAARRSGMGAGIQTAALSAGGADVPGTAQTSTDEYDGSTWTAAGALSTGRRYTAGCGTQTAAIINGGQNPGGTTISDTEEYDGSTWTSGGAWPKAIRQHVLLGTQTATLGSGGYSTTTEVEAYEYDGSTWTATGDMNQQRYVFQGFGTQTQGVVCGGEPTPSAGTLTETYDGSTFSNSPASLGNATAQGGYGKSPGTAGIVFGNAAGGITGATEEYNFSSTTITPAAWSSANAPSSPVYGGATGGTPTAAFLAAGFGTGGEPATQKTFNQHYNGTSWSEENDLNTARFYVGGAGTQTASLVFGGRIVPSPPANNNSEEYDGSSWTAGNTLGTARQFGGSNGTQTAALAIGGSSPTNAVEEYDGTNWASGTVYPTSDTANAVRSVGPQTAAFAVGGFPATTNTNFYDGSTWTAGPSLVAPTGEGNMSGSQTVAIKAGGNLGGTNYTNQSIRYDGTSWATSANLGTGRGALPSGPSGDFSSTTALCFGGPLGPPTFEANQLEEFTGETITVNPASNLSVS
jgi:hypothetical protein